MQFHFHTYRDFYNFLKGLGELINSKVWAETTWTEEFEEGYGESKTIRTDMTAYKIFKRDLLYCPFDRGRPRGYKYYIDVEREVRFSAGRLFWFDLFSKYPRNDITVPPVRLSISCEAEEKSAGFVMGNIILEKESFFELLAKHNAVLLDGEGRERAVKKGTKLPKPKRPVDIEYEEDPELLEGDIARLKRILKEITEMFNITEVFYFRERKYLEAGKEAEKIVQKAKEAIYLFECLAPHIGKGDRTGAKHKLEAMLVKCTPTPYQPLAKWQKSRWKEFYGEAWFRWAKKAFEFLKEEIGEIG